MSQKCASNFTMYIRDFFYFSGAQCTSFYFYLVCVMLNYKKRIDNSVRYGIWYCTFIEAYFNLYKYWYNEWKCAIKSIFYHFQKAFSDQKLSQTWECAFNPICVNFDRKMLLTWNLAQSYFGMLQKNGRKFFSKLQL